MVKYVLSKKAIDDLSNIWEYTFETWSERQAEKYYYMLLDTCKELANNKLKGKLYPEINKDVLGFRAGLHIIFYRNTTTGGIEVSRILHSRMDLKNRIAE